MSYCTKGQKAKVYYKFGDSDVTNIMGFDDTPINVTTSTVSGGTGNFDPLGYTINFLGGGGYFGLTATIYDYKVNVANGVTTIQLKYCGSSEFSVGYPFDPPSLKVYKNQKCDQPSKESVQSSTCKITVITAKNASWSASGSCPVTYSVACDDECPDGYVKCHSDSYPGYCCLRCGDVENRIDALTQLAKNMVG